MKSKINHLLNQLYSLIDKVGKRNFLLITFVLIIFIIAGLYATFSLSTSSEGLSINDGIKTYKFILGDDNTENSVTISAGSSKNIAITVSNQEKIKLQYGIYYTSTNDLTNIDLGYDRNTEYLPNGMIESNQDYIVTIKIDNNSLDNATIRFGIIYGLENGGELELDANQHFLSQKWNFPLSDVEPGSYVKYIGNNGCTSGHCDGTNANYVSDEDMGYCYSKFSIENNLTFKFKVNGWRVGYIKSNSVYLTSAGAPNCLATDSTGIPSDVPTASAETTKGIPFHLKNLNDLALQYCNIAYVNNNTCTSSNIHTFNAEDFSKITGKSLSTNSCYLQLNSNVCGHNNDVINNGSYYWINTFIDSNPNLNVLFYWDPNRPALSSDDTKDALGVRPVIRLDSSVVVTSGAGTYQDPYMIDNLSTIKDLSGNMNNGVNRDANWNQTDGTITTDGISNYIDCGLANYEFGDKISVIIRVKFHEIDVNKEYDFFGNWENAGFGLYLYKGNLVFNVFTDTSSSYKNFVSNFQPELETWYTIIGVYDGTNLSLFLDGSKLTLNSLMTEFVEGFGENTDSVTGDIKKNDTHVLIGANFNLSGIHSEFTNATYSDALIFTRALTESEIATNYSDVPNPPNKEKLLLYYDFKR